MTGCYIDTGNLRSPCLSCDRLKKSKRIRKCRKCTLPEEYDNCLRQAYGIWTGEEHLQFQPLNFLDFSKEVLIPAY